MKYIKEFENSKQNSKYPEEGDYIIIKDKIFSNQSRQFFLESHIGKVIRQKDGQLWHISGSGSVYLYAKYDEKFKNMQDKFLIGRDDIEFFSKNKEDVEEYIATKKFNL